MPHATTTEDGRSRGIPQINDEPWDDPRSLSTFSTFRQLNGQYSNGSRHMISYPESETSFTESTSSVSSSPQQETSSLRHSGNESISQEDTVEDALKKNYLLDASTQEIVPKASNSYKYVNDGKDAGVQEKNRIGIYSSDLSQNNPNTNGQTLDKDDETVKEDAKLEDACFLLSISLGRNDRRFGFSVIGGFDEGFSPKIEQITSGSPADRADLEVGDEILEVNGKSLDNCNHKEVISHIHQCIRSRTICLRVKRKTSCKLALDLSQNSNVQDAFVIAVEQQARERLEKLSALKKIKPVDMTKLSQELNECSQGKPELNGVIENNPIYVTTVPEIHNATLERIKKDQLSRSNGQVHDSGVKGDIKSPHLIGSQPTADHDQELELKQEILDAQDPGDETLSLSSPETPPRERLLIEPQTLDPSVHFTQNCVSIETLLPNFPDKSKSPETLITGTTANGEAPGMEQEFRQHREMAVDVPDSFVGISKTAPRYPPPKSYESDLIKGKKDLSDIVPVNDEAKQLQIDVVNNSVNKQMHDVSSKNKFVPETNAVFLCDRTIDNTDKEQIERIRKYQDDIKRRKEAEERQAKEDDFLRTSLRGSKKLQALENIPPQPPKRGVINTAFDLEEQRKDQFPSAEADTAETPELLQTYGASDLLQSLYRLKNSLQGNGPKDADLLLLEGLIRNKDFQNILTVHNKVQEVCCFKFPPTPTCADAEESVQEVLNVLQGFPIPEAVELSDILTKFEFEGLMFSHDKIAERQSVPAVTPDEELLDRASHYTEGSVKIVKIDKTNEPLGATVRNEGEAVVIGRIVKGGAAEKSGLLHEGDEILEVNGVEMRGKSVNDVCDILATMAGTLTFLIVPAQYESCRSLCRDVVMHVKAHFDYDPDDDLYIPCRELGISFQKGDILHVINQEDPNWWQAYQEGEEDQALAGLVPSKAFQQQRESMKQAIVGEANSKEKSKKAKFLCAKKYNKKKKKKIMYSANLSDEFDSEPVLTYEEVALYYPRANRKRPVVLIGPPNIGRHEIRQRLMEDTERFSAAVPHTSRSKRDPEVDGVDYHFISRSQFEADIMGGKFVEHGEYEKNYYGTSLDAIRAVVNSGKICVLNLHPQSLKILKNSDLKPYVVFVAPPSLEKLRQNRMRNGDYVKDDELKDIIEKAREMEDSYGHFFDMVIINSDIDKAYNELLKEINTLEREPQWVPATWLKSDCN